MLLLSIAAAEPAFSHVPGVVEEGFELTVEADEVDLGEGWVPVEGPLLVETSTSILARDEDGEVRHTYVFVDEVLASLNTDDARIRSTLLELPTVLLTVDHALSTTEQAADIEWSEDGSFIVGGVRKQGNASLGYPKNNLRLNFRSSYGEGRWDVDLYQGFESGLEPATSHDSLTLRSGSHDSLFYLGARGQYLRNRWMDETQLAMGHLAPHGRYAHAFLNGDYIGVYHVRERFGAGLLSEMLGGDEDDYEAVNGGVVVDGGGAGWADVLSARGDWEAMVEVVDVVNFIDYVLLNFYAANAWDWWPEHNWMASGSTQQGGWMFHASDSDICLVYDPSTNILSAGGPSWLFSELVAEGHPDFHMLLTDRIHALFEGEGPLTAEAAGARYAELSVPLEDAVVAEAARWGGTSWNEELWEVERSYLLGEWFPARTDRLLEQLRGQGWYPLDAPVIEGEEPSVTVSRVGQRGGVVVTLNGEDPRLPGGEMHPDALGPAEALELSLDGGRVVSARVYDDGVWGPRVSETFPGDQPAPVLLNEANTVASHRTLNDGDEALGFLEGNGGDWLEFVVVQHVDLDGWRLVDHAGNTVVFRDLVLPPGALFTLASELPEDTAFDPERGDWRLHLTLGGEHAEGELDVHHKDWTVSLFDASGRLRAGPLGEGVQLTGVGSDEVLVRSGELYVASEGSTFGALNPGQDLSALRATPYTPPATIRPSCSPASAPLWLFSLALVLVACRRDEPVCYVDADGDGWGDEPTSCDAPSVSVDGDCDDLDASVNPGATEVCGPADDDCDGLLDEDDPDLSDAIPLYVDADGDGFGGDVVGACELGDGLTVVSGDCDDDNEDIHPGAPEDCDAIDADCDGVAGGEPGDGDECPVSSCVDQPEGPIWLALPDGGAAQVYCRDGWTLGFVRNTSAASNQRDFGAADTNLTDLAQSPEDASVSELGLMGWLNLNALDWSELRVAAYTNGVETATSASIPREDFRLDFGQPGYLLYGPDYYWCGGPASYTDGGEGAVDNPADAPLDCKGHGSLGSGWDFSDSPYANAGLSLCGSDGSAVMSTTIPWSGWLYYGAPGGAQAIWVR